MDIEEIKKYSQNKIEADELIKQVRKQIKETTWEKQNLREGFTETFKPLISQFEDPGEESKKQNIFTQNKEMLQNQLALTQGIRNNQLALKGIKDQQDHFNRALEHLENLADMEDLLGERAIEDEEDDKDDQAQAPLPKDDQTQAPLPKDDQTQAPLLKEDKSKILTKDYFDRFLDNKESQDTLKKNGFDNNPSYYFDKNIDINELDKLIDNVSSDLKGLHEELKNIANIYTDKKGYLTAESTATIKGPTLKTQKKIKTFKVLSIYMKNLMDLVEFRTKFGSGLFSNPEELLHRFELLNGSLVAGNNGVLPEFIQIAHRLRDLGILTNKQLNTLLRKVI